MEKFNGSGIIKWWGDISDISGYPINPNETYVVDHHSGIDGCPEYVTLTAWENSHNHNYYPGNEEDEKQWKQLIDFPKTEKIELRLRQDLADRLPKDKGEKNAFINKAVENELEKPERLSRAGKTITPEKSAAARENGKKGGRPKKQPPN